MTEADSSEPNDASFDAGRTGTGESGETEVRSSSPIIPLNKSAEYGEPALTSDFSDSEPSRQSKSSQAAQKPLQQIDRYRVISMLGQGGFGAVYLAEDDVLQRKVSIKLPHRHRVRTQSQLKRYMNEAMMVAQLDHPKIVPVYDVGKLPDGICYVVSKYIESETLADLIKRSMSPMTALTAVIDVAETLQHVHEAGIVHRDMKPANILVSRDGEYFINDFGLAMIEVSESDRGLVIGTPSYMSPEQAQGEGHLVDGRSMRCWAVDGHFGEVRQSKFSIKSGIWIPSRCVNSIVRFPLHWNALAKKHCPSKLGVAMHLRLNLPMT